MKRKGYFLLTLGLLAIVLLAPQAGLAAPPQYTLTTNVVGCGSVDPASGTYKNNEWLLITATPCAGWSFDHWEANVYVENTLANPTHITMQSNALVTVFFAGGGPTPTPGATATPGATSTPTPAPPPGAGGEFFDDFNYVDSTEMASYGWWVRTGKGAPGPQGAQWLAENITFLQDPGNPANKLMQLTATTSGSGRTTTQAEVEYPEGAPDRFFEGTYAARVWFTNEPISGPDGDAIIETFFTISDWYLTSNNTNYCEMDFEYLPNGGWGTVGPHMWMSTWETTNNYNPSYEAGNYGGWHTLVIVVANGEVKYYIDGVLKQTHGGIYYPEYLMNINFNLWYDRGGLMKVSDTRTYIERVDWAYHKQNEVLTTAQVQASVAGLRQQGVVRKDTIVLP